MKKVNFINIILSFCILLLTNISAYSQALSYQIAGTGVTECFGSTTPIACPTNPAVNFYGQFHGITPSYQNNGNGTITDLNTGLMWIQARGTKISWDSAFIMAAQCNAGGFNDWRVPTIKELYSLINFNGRSGQTVATCFPYIDTAYFGWTTGDTVIGERIIDAQDWSATKYTGLTMNGDTTIFGVNFVDGRIKGYPKYQPPFVTTTYKLYVRFVRGNTAYGINNFVDNSDSTITDNATGLMWAKYDDGNGMNWQDALAFAQTKNASNYCGHNDWRLPHAKELQSIVDYSRSIDATASAAINPMFNCTAITDEGGFTDYPFYWTSTTHLEQLPSTAMIGSAVYITFGEALGYMKMPPTATYYTLKDVHGAGAQRSDPKAGDVSSYYLGLNQTGDSLYGLGPQGDVIRINNFVRLIRTDSNVNGINKNTNYNIFNVYPNPTTGIVNIEADRLDKQNYKIALFDAYGKLLLQEKNSKIIDLSEFCNGLYILNLTTENSNSIIRKIFLIK